MKEYRLKNSKFFGMNIMVLLIGLLVFQSCDKKDMLNPTSKTLLSDEVVFDSKQRIESQVNGLYQKLKHGNFLGSKYLIMSDIRAGDFFSNTNNAAVGATTYQLNNATTTDEVVQLWERGYQVINAANVFIQNMELLGIEVTGQEVGDNYIAEARLIRGLSYYYLLQLYARPYWDNNGGKPGLPLRLTGNTGPDDYNLARSTVKEVYDQILEDLNFAENNLPDSYGSNTLNTNRAHRNTAIALKTRVYLSMGDYPGVITEADKIVSIAAPFQASTGVHNALVSDIRDVFQSPYVTSESIFSMPFTSEDSPGTALSGWFSPTGGAFGNGDAVYMLNTEGIVANTSWGNNDVRRTFIAEDGGHIWLIKFNDPRPYLDSAPVIRYSEVLLSLAEALAKNTNSVNSRAVELLSAVRHRSDSSVQFTASDFSSVDALVDAIVTERQIEFLGEGIRNADIMRLGLDIPEKSRFSVSKATPSNSNYIWPISVDELSLNNLMENN